MEMKEFWIIIFMVFWLLVLGFVQLYIWRKSKKEKTEKRYQGEAAMAAAEAEAMAAAEMSPREKLRKRYLELKKLPDGSSCKAIAYRDIVCGEKVELDFISDKIMAYAVDLSPNPTLLRADYFGESLTSAIRGETINIIVKRRFGYY